jgi:hypothetical protein
MLVFRSLRPSAPRFPVPVPGLAAVIPTWERIWEEARVGHTTHEAEDKLGRRRQTECYPT